MSTQYKNDSDATSWHVLDLNKVFELLQVDGDDITSHGLSEQEALERMLRYGPNELSKKEKENICKLIWKQLANILVGILVIVVMVSIARAIVEMKSNEPDESIILTSWIQVGLIIIVISINTYIGVRQERSASNAVDALQSMLSLNARVVRGNIQQIVPSKDLVPGDIVIVNTGDCIPADIRLLETSNLCCQEAALTGESMPVEKSADTSTAKQGLHPEQIPLGDRFNMAFSGTLVNQGSAFGIVVATGDSSQIGMINKLVHRINPKKTAVLEQIDYVSKIIAALVIISSIATFVVARWMAHNEWFESVSIALVCAVAMIPEGLQAIVTLVYAWGVMNMARKNAIIRSLPAVETLGSVTVICTDKTGTLTQNIMSLMAMVTSNAVYRFNMYGHYRVNTNFVRDDSFLSVDAGKTENPDLSPSLEWIRSVMAGGILCSRSILSFDAGCQEDIGDPTELALLRASYYSGVEIAQLRANAKKVAEIPFSSELKFMATIHEPVLEVDGNIPANFLVLHVKGSADALMKLCLFQCKNGVVTELETMDDTYWEEKVDSMTTQGLRVLALCRATVERSSEKSFTSDFILRQGRWLTMVAIVAIMDPLRPECMPAIRCAHTAGIRVAMITGDHINTAKTIASKIGIISDQFPDAITGPEIDIMNEDELKQSVSKCNVYARMSPKNKFSVVRALQTQGEVCGMTGDGVNDAPALKIADMGVAMGRQGTDVARESALMILLDDNFATIIAAVKEGRVVWENIRKILLVNEAINNAQGLSVLFGLLCGLDGSPLSALQVLYSNLICAVTLGMVLAIEPAEDGVMDVPPRRVGKRLVGRFLLLRIALGTIILTFSVVASGFLLLSLNDQKTYGTACVMNCPKYQLNDVRAIAFNTLDFGAISITLSARFAYNSSFSKRILTGNKYCWHSVFLVIILQLFVTYCPGVNSKIFQMNPMDGVQWGIVVSFTALVFIVMECEKWIRRILKTRNVNTDDM